MIKSVALARLVYCMLCSKIPKAVCNELTMEVTSYWWGQKEKERTIHWAAWKKMIEPKDKGG